MIYLVTLIGTYLRPSESAAKSPVHPFAHFQVPEEKRIMAGGALPPVSRRRQLQGQSGWVSHPRSACWSVFLIRRYLGWTSTQQTGFRHRCIRFFGWSVSTSYFSLFSN